MIKGLTCFARMLRLHREKCKKAFSVLHVRHGQEETRQ